MTTTTDAAPPRERRGRVPMAVRVTRVERLSPSMVRVGFGGGDLDRFSPSEYADSYVKLVFEHPDAERMRPLDLERVREVLPQEHWPRQRTYTVRSFDGAELVVDFVVHGDEGLAGPWAAAAQVGDELHLLGPGGGWSPAAQADWYLLAGDESALPAVAVAVERLPSDASGVVVVEVHGPGDELPLAVPPGVELVWLHRHEAAVGSLLVDHVRRIDWPAGDVDAFVHGEAASVKDLRRLLRVERAVPADRLSISGYWRLGADDERWRAVKREWNRDVEAEEAAALG